MDQQAREAREMAKQLPFKEKLSYIWTYYHNWFYAALIVFSMIGITVYQIASKPSYDLVISYYGENMFTEESIAELEGYLAQFVDDIDGDGVQTVHITTNFLPAIETPMQQGEIGIMQKQMAEVSAGTYPVFMFDKTFADSVKVGSYEGMFYPMRDLESIPEVQEMLQLPDKQELYWLTRAPFDAKNNQKKLDMYARALEIETAIFGE